MRAKIKRFLIDSDFDNLTKETCLEYLENKRKEMKLISYSIEVRLIYRFLLSLVDVQQVQVRNVMIILLFGLLYSVLLYPFCFIYLLYPSSLLLCSYYYDCLFH